MGLKLTHYQPINLIGAAFYLKALEMAKPPHPRDLLKAIRRLAREEAYSFSDHAIDDRMVEREFDIDDVLKILAVGDIVGAITPGKRVGEWKCVVVGPLPWTSREAGIVTVVRRGERLIFVTVKWMDR